MRRARHKTGSVVYDKHVGTWRFMQWIDGKRKSQTIGTKREFPTKAAAWRKAEKLRIPEEKPLLDQVKREIEKTTMNAIAARYESERLPERFSTARMYRSWLHNHILPRWGAVSVNDLQPLDVELWLRNLELSPKSKAHIRAMLRILVDFAMCAGVVKISRNAIELVVVTGATKRTRQPRSLTVEEFQKLRDELAEPFKTMAQIAVCFGLRVSELLALQWQDVDWLNGKLRIERAIVMQNVDEVKTLASRRQMSFAPELLAVLKLWRQQTQFSADTDWIFASPVKIGRLPVSYAWYDRQLKAAAERAGIVTLSSHAMRHTYRSWLDAVGTPIAVQQKLMRHTDIRTTMNVYGDVVTDQESEAHSKVVGLALLPV
jgi:integrase